MAATAAVLLLCVAAPLVLPDATWAASKKSCEARASHDPDVPVWARHRHATVLVDSVLLGSMPGIRKALPCWRLDMYGRPALMIRIAEQELRSTRKRIAPVAIVGLGYNSLWERNRGRYGYWSARFRSEADRLIRTLRRQGAKEIVWVTLREPKAQYLTSTGIGELGKYSWYFPYVNEQLRRMDRRRDNMVLADWTAVSDRRGLTYDSIHVTPDGAALMGRTIEKAIFHEAQRITRLTKARERRESRRDRPKAPASGDQVG